jgi:hypothetical protein
MYSQMLEQIQFKRVFDGIWELFSFLDTLLIQLLNLHQKWEISVFLQK